LCMNKLVLLWLPAVQTKVALLPEISTFPHP
jgi:hypothetical protein